MPDSFPELTSDLIYYAVLGFLAELEAHNNNDQELDPEETLVLFNLSNVGFTLSEDQFALAITRAAEAGLLEWVEDSDG